MLFPMCLARSGLMTKIFQQQKMYIRTKSFFNLTITPLVKNISQNPSLPLQLNSVRPFNTTTVKLQEEKPHDHARLWVIEKRTSALLVALIPCGLLVPNKLFDSILAILITAHTYWGMEAVMVEYVRVLLFGPLIPKIALGFVYVMTVLMLGGLFYLIFNDIGMCRAFWRIWRNMRKPRDSFRRR